MTPTDASEIVGYWFDADILAVMYSLSEQDLGVFCRFLREYQQSWRMRGRPMYSQEIAAWV